MSRCSIAALGFEDAPDYDRLRSMLVAGIVDAVAFDWEVRLASPKLQPCLGS